MANLIEQRFSKLGPKVAAALENRRFKAWYFDGTEEAVDKLVSLIPKEHLVSWGGSTTLADLGVRERLTAEGLSLLDRDKAANPAERIEILRKALTCDTYLCGTNAISEDGQLVNVDGLGSRVAPMMFGPSQVIILAGMNKVAKTPQDAMTRARHVAAPTNAQRFPALKTPCNETGACMDCSSPDTLCNFLTTIRYCNPPGRIKVILVGKALGF